MKNIDDEIQETQTKMVKPPYRRLRGRWDANFGIKNV